MDREAWRAMVRGVTMSQATEATEHAHRHTLHSHVEIHSHTHTHTAHSFTHLHTYIYSQEHETLKGKNICITLVG